MNDSKNLKLETIIGVVYLLPGSKFVSSEDLIRQASDETRSYAMQLGSMDRKNEFLRSRWLLRQISNLEDPKKLSEGNLNWPKETVGSISHKEGHVAVVFEKKSNVFFDSIGIDMEKKVANDHILSRVGTDEEVNVLKRLNPGFSLNEIAALLFSAKETIYKAVFPVVQKKFWFDQATIVNAQESEGVLKLGFSICETVAGFKNRNILVEISKINLDQQDYWLARSGYRGDET